jgi:putative FmdB family regulatory protein
MPIYEYLCPECACKFEMLRSVTKANEDASCPKCRHIAKRVFSRFASFSKGDGVESTPIAGTGGSCSGCTASSCSSCNL